MDGLFSNILNMSISASWLILAVILLRAILTKAPKGFRYILWALVAIRLLCPFTIESSFSLVPEVPQFGQERQNSNNENLENENFGNANSDNLNSEKVDYENENQGNIVQGNLSQDNVSQDNTNQDNVSQDNVGQDTLDKLPSGTVTVTPNENTSDTNNQTQGSVIIADTTATEADTPESKRTWSEVFIEAMPWVWLTDGILMLVYILISYLVLWNKVKVSIPIGENTYICDEIRSPFILGIVRPHIYVPSSITREQMTYIMAHEKEHLRCFDYIWKPLGFVILALHWFNPLVWVAYVLMCRDL